MPPLMTRSYVVDFTCSRKKYTLFIIICSKKIKFIMIIIMVLQVFAKSDNLLGQKNFEYSARTCTF